MKKLFLILTALSVCFPGYLLAAPGQGVSSWTAQTQAIASGDLVGITDISDTTQSDNGTSKKATMTQLGTFMGTLFEPVLGNPGTTGYILSSTTAGVRSWVANSGGATTLAALTDVTGDGAIDYMLYDDGDGTFSFRAAPAGDGTGTDDQTAAEVPFTPNGTIAATDVQAAIQEVRDEAGGGGYTDLTSFIAQTPWRLFYSNTAGDVTELAFGADGEYLKSNGVSLAPSWATPSGAAHDALTLGIPANGLSLATQQLSLALASTSATGALSNTDWNTFNNKQAALTNPIVEAGAQSVTGKKTFDNSMIGLKGTSTGVTTFSTANTGATDYTLTFPAAGGNIAIVSDIPSVLQTVRPTASSGSTVAVSSEAVVGDALALKAPLTSASLVTPSIGVASGTSLTLSGTLTAGSVATPNADNAKSSYIPSTSGESSWYTGPNHNADGTNNDNFEIRQSPNVGTDVRLKVSAVTGKVVVGIGGIEGTATDTITDCSSFSATGGGIFYDDSEGVWKKCQDNVLTVLDTSGAGAETNTLETVTTDILENEIPIGASGGGAVLFGTNLPTATTIGTAYIYRAGGTDVADADIVSTIARDSELPVVATSAEINTGTDNAKFVSADALAGSNAFTKEIGWSVIDSDTVTAVADGKQAAAVPASMVGMELKDLTCSVADLNSAASGTTTVVLRRVRGATAADMTSTGVTIDYNAYTASDETVDTASDELALGDKLYIDINAVTSAVQKGLSCTALFRLP